MKNERNRTLTVIYWTMGILISLGAFGHGFVGVRHVSAPVEANLPTNVRQVIWIVWYFVSAAC